MRVKAKDTFLAKGGKNTDLIVEIRSVVGGSEQNTFLDLKDLLDILQNMSSGRGSQAQDSHSRKLPL